MLILPVRRFRRFELHRTEAAVSVGRAGVKRPHHFSAVWPRQSQNGQFDAAGGLREDLVNRVLERACASGGAAVLAAGDAHMPADAGAVVAAVDDEIVPLRLQSDGAVDRRGQ